MYSARRNRSPPNTTRRNHFSIIFSICFIRIIETLYEIKKCFPLKGTLALTPGMGLRGPFRTKDLFKKNVRKLFTLRGHFFKKSKTIFKISSYIQKMTQNSINTLKITICNTNHTKNTEIHFHKSKMFEIFWKIIKQICYYISNFHKLYFIYFMCFVYFVYLFVIYSQLADRIRFGN